MAKGTVLSEDDLVFCHDDGTPLLPDVVTKAWSKIARKVGLEGIRLHDARHTHASLMLKQNIHPKIVSERLGHATVAFQLHWTFTLMLSLDFKLRPQGDLMRVWVAIGLQNP